MKLVKKGLKSVFFSAALYALLLLLISFFVLRGTLGEERVESLCIFASALSCFVSVLVYRVICKDGTFALSILFGWGCFPLAVLAAFLFGGDLLWDRVILMLAAAAAAGVGANVLYAKSGFGKKRRGRARGANR